MYDYTASICCVDNLTVFRPSDTSASVLVVIGHILSVKYMKCSMSFEKVTDYLSRGC